MSDSQEIERLQQDLAIRDQAIASLTDSDAQTDAVLEIERLKATVANLSKTNLDYHGRIYGELQPEIVRLQAEVERHQAIEKNQLDTITQLRGRMADNMRDLSHVDEELKRTQVASLAWQRRYGDAVASSGAAHIEIARLKAQLQHQHDEIARLYEFTVEKFGRAREEAKAGGL